MTMIRKSCSSRETREIVQMGIDPETTDWLANEREQVRNYWQFRTHVRERPEHHCPLSEFRLSAGQEPK